MIKKVAIILSSIAITVVAFLFFNERLRMSLASESGELEIGNKFGVTIGNEVQTARPSLERRGFRFLHSYCYAQKEGMTPVRDECVCDERCRYVFEDTTIANGVVNIAGSRGLIQKISWSYNFSL